MRASAVTPGMHVADIGAGTGLFTRLFSREVGPQGKVYAVDISRPFVENIMRESREQGLSNIEGVVKDLEIDKAYDALPGDVKKTTSPSTLFQMFLLWKYHVASMDRKSFGQIGTENMHFLRLSIATGMDDLKTGMERMASAVADRGGFARFIAAREHLS